MWKESFKAPVQSIPKVTRAGGIIQSSRNSAGTIKAPDHRNKKNSPHWWDRILVWELICIGIKEAANAVVEVKAQIPVRRSAYGVRLRLLPVQNSLKYSKTGVCLRETRYEGSPCASHCASTSTDTLH